MLLAPSCLDHQPDALRLEGPEDRPVTVSSFSWEDESEDKEIGQGDTGYRKCDGRSSLDLSIHQEPNPLYPQPSF